MRMEYACLGKIEATKVEDGGKVGIVEGHIASWKTEPGSYPDRFERGAFAESIEEHKRRGNRPVRLLRQHDRMALIGGFPIDTVKEDAKGLWGAGHLNLDIQLARDSYALANQGVLRDFSVGFRALDFRFEKNEAGIETRVISKAMLYEGSLVDEPMNPHAVVTAVKSSGFAVLPESSPALEWDAAAARERVLDMKARDGDASLAFLDAGRVYLIADVDRGQLVAVKAAVLEAADALKALGSDAPTDVVQRCSDYLDRLGLESPFEAGGSRSITVEQVKLWTPREMESALSSGAPLSRSAVRYLTKHQGGLVDPAGPGVQFSEAELQALRDLSAVVRRGAA